MPVTRVLFFAEAVTLAHIVRPYVLARGLPADSYEIHLARPERYGPLFDESGLHCHPLDTIDSHRFLNALAKGSPVYDYATLRRYVETDLELIDRVKPDLLVGDFRLSLGVSANLVHLPYLTLTNAYWSPYAETCFPVPEIPLTRLLGVAIAQRCFDVVRPLAFAYHALAMNRVRRHYALSPLAYDLRQVYTHADYTLYVDIPELFPLRAAPDNHSFLGPILWSPKVSLPAWWDRLPEDRPSVYLTPGSSGDPGLLPLIVDALAELPVTVMVATAGRVELGKPPANTYVAEFLPGLEAAKRASLVICNGGSLTTQQALTVGTPILGLVNNMDQNLNMNSIEKAGAGKILRGSQASRTAIRDSVNHVLQCHSYSRAAAELASIMARYDPHARFASLLARVLEK